MLEAAGLLTTVPRNLHELSHHFLFIAEGRILIDEFRLDGKLLHVVCNRFPGPSIPGGQWDYHLWRKHKQTLEGSPRTAFPPQMCIHLFPPHSSSTLPQGEAQAPQPGTSGSSFCPFPRLCLTLLGPLGYAALWPGGLCMSSSLLGISLVIFPIW